MKLFPSRAKPNVAISGQHCSSAFPIWSEMCIESMEPKHGKSDYLRGTMKPGGRPEWNLPPRFVMEHTAEAYNHYQGYNAMRPIQKCFPRQQKHPQPGKPTGGPGYKVDKKLRRQAAARQNQPPPGAMAPDNTTQYIMANMYEDMTTHDDASPTTKVCFEPLTTDSGYDGCLAFQQRDFEEEFALYWQPE